MTLKEAIDAADRMRPNAVHIDDKRRALWDLEAEFAEMTGTEIVDLPGEDDDPDLIIPSPHDIVYVMTLMAFIDYAQEETDLYQLDAPMANQKKDEVKAFYRRHHRGGGPQITGVFL